MGPYRQRFLYHLSTPVTLLGCEAWVHSYHLVTGSFSLILQDSEKRAPTGVHDALCEVMVFDHAGDVQVLNGNMMILLGIVLSRLEVKITALTCDLEMRLSSVLCGLASSLASLLASAQCTLFASQRYLRGAKEPGVLDRVSFRVGQEDFQAHVNPDVRMITGAWKMFGLGLGFADDESVPMPVSTQDQMHGLWGSFYRTMKLDLEGFAHLFWDHEMFLLFMQIDIFAILSQVDRVPTVRLFETRETHARDVVLLGSQKPLERLPETVSEHLDGGSRNMGALSLKSIFQVILAWESPLLLILCLEHLKHLIVNDARLDQALHEQGALLLIRIEAILKRSHTSMYSELDRRCQALRPPDGGARFTPMRERRGLTRRFGRRMSRSLWNERWKKGTRRSIEVSSIFHGKYQGIERGAHR
jgi:hypothetical protein